jgi:hypothetical protein
MPQLGGLRLDHDHVCLWLPLSTPGCPASPAALGVYRPLQDDAHHSAALLARGYTVIILQLMLQYRRRGSHGYARWLARELLHLSGTEHAHHSGAVFALRDTALPWAISGALDEPYLLARVGQNGLVVYGSINRFLQQLLMAGSVRCCFIGLW